MAKSKNGKVTVRCVNMSASEVTGSGYLVECETGEKILLDLGLYQGRNDFESYKINKRKFDFNPKEITAVIISHINCDHYCMLPKFVHDGGDCKFYLSAETVDFVKPMLEDSARIMERDVIGFSKQYHKNYEPVYTLEDVKDTLPHFRGCSKNEVHYITDNVWFVLKPAGHIFGSCQVELYIKKLSGSIVKIGYSGDLGNIIFDQPFVEDFEPIIKCNLYIGECTYNSPNRSVGKKYRERDLETIIDIVRQTCVENKGIILIPTFSLQRMETMIYTLWKLFKDDPNFHIPIVVDSPLAIRLLDCFQRNLTGEWLDIFNEMMAWDNIRLIKDIEGSMACVEDRSPKIVLSSSGMLTKGRSVMYLKKVLPRSNCTVLECGYAAVGSLSWIIKNASDKKPITIDKVAYPNRADIKCLRTFSSHMQFEQLQNYYTNLANNGCETIWLVHSDDGKLEFKKALEERISKIFKTTKIIATNRETVARL